MWQRSLCFAASLSLAATVAPQSIFDFPLEVRRRNIVRLSTEVCNECMTLESFYEANPRAFVLFYERALTGSNKYKAAVVQGFHDACEELRWSRIACGVVDMVNDKEYGKRYIDPKTAPAHIIVRDGEPVQLTKPQVNKLMAKPGDKETILWHLTDALEPEDGPGAVDISVEVTTAEAFERLLKQHEVVVAGFFADSTASIDSFRAAAQRLVLHGDVPSKVDRADEKVPKAGSKKWRKWQERRRIVFAAVRAKKARPSSLEDGTLAAFVGTELVAGHTAVKTPVAIEAPEMTEALQQTMKGLQDVVASRSTSSKSEL